MEMDLEKFDPTTAELKAMVADSVSIDLTDLESVRKGRIALKNVRVRIEKRGKELRADALTFQKAVIAKEKELVGIIEPEENRLAQAEEDAKVAILRAERLRKLPYRRQTLDLTPNDLTDEQVLAMDDVAFQTAVDRLRADQIAKEQAVKQAELDARQAEIEAREKAIRDKEEADKREAKRQADLERARIDGEERARAEAERKRLADEAAAKRKADEERDAQAKLEKTKKLKAWLNDRGYTEQTKNEFLLEHTDTLIVLYKRIDVYQK